MTNDDKIKAVAREAAQALIGTAQATTAALNAKTATDIEWIKGCISEINAKLDGKFVTKEDFDLSIKASVAQRADHESRIRTLERYGFGAVSVLYVISVIIGWYVTMKK